MAYLFTFLFITTAFITPGVLFGPLEPFHIELIFAVLAILASIPSFSSSGLTRLPQTYAVFGVSFFVIMSIAVGGWLGGIPLICYSFLPIAAGFFLAAINCRKKWHFQLIVLSMVLCSTYYIVHGAIDLHNNVLNSPFLYSHEAVPRLRGLDYLHDPNDFAQAMVSLIPLVFLWRSKSWLANIFLLGVPISVLVYGMYLTHSRGSSIALAMVVLLALRKKIGTIPATIISVGFFAAVLAAGWGAGRAVNIDSGEGRLDAWSAGLQFVKAHPVFGIGYAQFANAYGITAHNSVVLCVAELGIPGFLCWVLLLVACFRFCLNIQNNASVGTLKELEPSRSAPTAFQLWATKRVPGTSSLLPAGMPASLLDAQPARIPAQSAAGTPWRRVEPVSSDAAAISPEELRQIGRLLFLSLSGFLTAGWFLSRAFSIWLFMYCGMICAVFLMSRDAGVPVHVDSRSILTRWTLGVAFVLLLAVYVILRIHNITG